MRVARAPCTFREPKATSARWRLASEFACCYSAVHILAPQNRCAGGSYLGPVRLGICAWLQLCAHSVNQDDVHSVAACFGIRLRLQRHEYSGTPEWMCRRVLSWSGSHLNWRVAAAPRTFGEPRRRPLGGGLLRHSLVAAAPCTSYTPGLMCRKVLSLSGSHRNLRVASAPCTFREPRRRPLGGGLLRNSRVAAAPCIFLHPRVDAHEGLILARFASDFACGCSADTFREPRRRPAACFGIGVWLQRRAHSATPGWMCRRV